MKPINYQYRVVYQANVDGSLSDQYFDVNSLYVAETLVNLLSKLRKHYSAIWIERRTIQYREEVIGVWDDVPANSPDSAAGE